jgi:negative regulator of flagellin synthesis FlgM
MQTHGPSCLDGPVSGTRSWWQTPDGPEVPTGNPRLLVSSGPDLRHEALDDGFRADLVARVRKEIAAGTYETPAKWEAALDRLLARLEAE